MADTAVIKVRSSHSPRGEAGQRDLAPGKNFSMRLCEDEAPWRHQPPPPDAMTRRSAMSCRARLHLEGQMMVVPGPGDSWVVPRGAEHADKILESFSAVEATHPPLLVHGRDE